MRKVFSVVFTGLVLALSSCANAHGYQTESVDKFATTIATPSVVVIDVRTPEEYATGHIPNSININVESADFDSQISTVDKNSSVAVYCHSGRRSAIAAGKMMELGFTQVHNLDGGISAWVASGRQVVQ